MIYKVDESIFQKLQNNLPFLRYNDASFVLLEEAYLSENGREETPWINPAEVLVYRKTSGLQVSAELNLEIPASNFESFCKDFFDNSKTKVLQNARYYVMLGTKDTLDAMEFQNSRVMLAVFEKANQKIYLNPNRYIVRIPCGEYNLDLVKFVDFDELYVELTKINSTVSNQGLQSLHRNLDLGSELQLDWANIYIELNRSISAKS